jgi:hypothetical protein
LRLWVDDVVVVRRLEEANLFFHEVQIAIEDGMHGGLQGGRFWISEVSKIVENEGANCK